MFIKKSFADEIAFVMDQKVVQAAAQAQLDAQGMVVEASEHLNAAAEIFEKSGMIAEAELITGMLEVMAAKKKKSKDKNKAKDKKKSKKPAKKPAKKVPSSEKMLENLKTKGWVFDENGAVDGKTDHNCADVNCADCGDMSFADDEEEL